MVRSTNSQNKLMSERRVDQRLRINGFKVAILQKTWLFLKEYVECEVISLSSHGVGVIASDFNLKVNNKINIKLILPSDEFLPEECITTGTVEYCNVRDNLEFYGISFNKTPAKIVALIKKQIKILDELNFEVDDTPFQFDLENENNNMYRHKSNSKSESETSDSVMTSAATRSLNSKKTNVSKNKFKERRAATRYQTSGLQIRARNRGLSDFSNFIPGEAKDISLGGIGFQSKTDKNLDEKVRLELKYNDLTLRATGNVVTHVETENGHFYGINFTLVPLKFKSLMKIIALNK